MSSNAQKTLSYDFTDNYGKKKERKELFSSPRRTLAIDAEHRRIDAVLGSFDKAVNYLTPRYVGIDNVPTTTPVVPTKKAQSPPKLNPMTSNKRRHESIHQHKEKPQKKMRYCGGENTDPIIKEKRKNMTIQQRRPPPLNLQRGDQVPPPRAAYTPHERKPMLDHNRDQHRALPKPPTTKIAMAIKELQRPVPQQPPSGKYSRVPQQHLQPPPTIRVSQQEIKSQRNQITSPQSLVEPATKMLYSDPMAKEKRKNITTQRPPAQKLHYKQVPPAKAPYKPQNRKPMLEHNRDQLFPPIKPPTTKITMPTKELQRPVPQQLPNNKYSREPQQYLQSPPPIHNSQQEIKPHHNQIPPPQSLIETITKRQEIQIENLTGKGKLPPGLEGEIRKFAAKNDERGCNFHKDFGRMRFWVRLYENRRVVVTLENKEMKVTCVPDDAVFIRKNHR